jgi:hypothetical protein
MRTNDTGEHDEVVILLARQSCGGRRRMSWTLSSRRSSQSLTGGWLELFVSLAMVVIVLVIGLNLLIL